MKIKSNKILRDIVRNLHDWKWTVEKISKYRIKRAEQVNVFFLYFDPTKNQPGLADRIKTIVSCYYIAKENGYKFRIVFKSPFELKEFLLPNEIMWDADEEDLEYSLFDTRFFTYDGKMIHFNQNKQYICFNFHDRPLDKLNNNDSLWKTLFSQLFVFSPLLYEMAEQTGLAENSYIAIHLRFLNVFAPFEKGNAPLSEKQQLSLIDRCKNTIWDILNITDESLKVLVFSDSAYFLSKLHDMPVTVLNCDQISHISYTSNMDEIRKTFFDLLMISRAKTVYRVLAPELYNSNYSVVAAKIGGKDIYDHYA